LTRSPYSSASAPVSGQGLELADYRTQLPPRRGGRMVDEHVDVSAISDEPLNGSVGMVHVVRPGRRGGKF
jgi:hypothetical protein